MVSAALRYEPRLLALIGSDLQANADRTVDASDK
jgi:hypothetical protein